jgi:hypothetical protein
MGELIDAVEESIDSQTAPPAAEETPPEPPDNTVLQAGVEEVADEFEEGDPEPRELQAEDVPDELEFEVTVEGEKSNVSLKELRTSYQVRAYADRQIRETKMMQGKLIGARKALMQDPMFTIEQLFAGQFGNADRAHKYLSMLVGEWMNKELEFESLPEDQKQIWRDKRQLELEKKRMTEERQQEASTSHSTALTERQQQVDEQLRAALVKTKMGNSKEVRQAVLNEWGQSFKDGIRLTAEEAANIVKARRAKHFENLVKTLPEDELLDRFPEFANKVRKTDKKRVKQKKRQVLSTKTGKAAAPDGAPTKPVRRGTKPKFTSGSEFLSHLDKKFPK